MILSLDTSTNTCSAALLSEKEVLAEYTQNLLFTHSEKLMPLIDALFKDTRRHAHELEAVAVASGPGSFTGLRIGVSTARAFAQGLNIPAYGINTLEALAHTFPISNHLICPIMDARKQQVYTDVYQFNSSIIETDTVPTILLNPTVITLEELINHLKNYSKPALCIGDGSLIYREILRDNLAELYWELPYPLTYPKASLVGWCAQVMRRVNGITASYLELKPQYIRASEAERKRQQKS